MPWPFSPPKNTHAWYADFRPVQRELVIDIDISDYDELRTCGSGGHICTKCWPFMAVAIQVGVWGATQHHMQALALWCGAT